MATSGIINGTAYQNSSSTSSYSVWIEWKRNSFSIENNTSNITVYLKIKCTGYSSSAFNLGRKPTVTLSVNGTARTPTINYIDTRNYVECTIATWTGAVSHNDDGSLSCPISASFTHYGSNSLTSGSVSGAASITTIPRASVINYVSCSSSYFDGTLTYKYTPKSASYYNKCNISLNLDGEYIQIKSISIGKKTASQQTATVILSSSELTTIYKNLPTSIKGTLRFTLRTYSDSGYSNQIGSAEYKEITLTIPTSVVPSIGKIELNPVNITTKDGVSRNILVQGKNKLQILLSDCAAGSGSSIASYMFSGPGITTTMRSAPTNSTSYTFNSSGAIYTTGTLTYKVIITDARKRTYTTTASIECHSYKAPSFASFTAFRCNDTGQQDDDGKYVKCSIKVDYSSVNSTNKSTVQIYCKANTDNSWTACQKALDDSTTKSVATIVKKNGNQLVFNESSTYAIYATVTDNYNGSVDSSTVTIFGASRIFNIRKNGNGIAFGKLAERDDLLESKWPMQVDDQITFGKGVQGSIYTDQNDDGVNIVYLFTGQDTSSGAKAGVALHKTSLYVPSESNSGIVNLGSSGRKWNQLYAANGDIVTSDRNVKTDIKDMSDTQEQLFNELKPVTYRFVDGTSDRTHYGFISQDIEESLVALGLKGTDFAGFCKDIQVDEDGVEIIDENGKNIYDYSLRYSEFIALNTHMIQKLQAEIVELKATIEELKSTVRD